MKRCPRCERAYADEALKFCRHDGALLISDSTSLNDSQPTLARLPPQRDTDSVATRIFPSGEGTAAAPTSSSLTTPLKERRRRAVPSKVIDSLAALPLINESPET